MKVTFRILGIGELFECNGNQYVKQSTRTARMVANGRVFYMEQLAICTVA